jgi:hypothetical protein
MPSVEKLRDGRPPAHVGIETLTSRYPTDHHRARTNHVG